MQILRHSEIAVTTEVYTHVPSAGTRKALRKLGEALDGSKPKPKGKKIKKRSGGRREPWRLLYSAAVKHPEGSANDLAEPSDQCRGGGI